MVEISHLTKHFPLTRGLLRRRAGVVQAVDDVSFTVARGETFGLVGESGCGKTTVARLLLKLIAPTAGELRFDGRDISSLGHRATRALRAEMQIVLQDPFSSLNPRRSVRQIIAEPLVVHGTDRRETRTRVDELLELCGLSAEHAQRFPHQLSGGQRQRVGVARALALNPKLVVLDEPVSALDGSVQAPIVNLLEELQDRLGLNGRSNGRTVVGAWADDGRLATTDDVDGAVADPGDRAPGPAPGQGDLPRHGRCRWQGEAAGADRRRGRGLVGRLQAGPTLVRPG